MNSGSGRPRRRWLAKAFRLHVVAWRFYIRARKASRN
jgi:hypothetical protein